MPMQNAETHDDDVVVKRSTRVRHTARWERSCKRCRCVGQNADWRIETTTLVSYRQAGARFVHCSALCHCQRTFAAVTTTTTASSKIVYLQNRACPNPSRCSQLLFTRFVRNDVSADPKINRPALCSNRTAFADGRTTSTASVPVNSCVIPAG